MTLLESNKNEKKRIKQLHLHEKVGGGKGGTNTSSAGQYDGNAFVGEGPLSTSGRERDLGSLPDEVDITKGSEGFQLEPKIGFITVPGDDDDIDIDIEDITIGDDFEIIDIDDSYIPPLTPALTPLELSQMLDGLNQGEILSLLGDIYGLTPEEILDLLISSPYWDLISECMTNGDCGSKQTIKAIINILGPLPSIPPVAPVTPVPTPKEDEINRPLSLSCCKKCDNGMYTNRCFPFDTENDEDCRFPTLEVCEDESEPRLPSMLDIFA